MQLMSNRTLVRMIAIVTFLVTSVMCRAVLSDELSEYKLKFYADGSFFVTPRVPNVLFQVGEIESDQYGEFRRAIVNHKISTVVLDSPGGNVYESLDMAGTIFDRGLSTYVPKEAECFSACSFMFFAGRERYSSGKLGVHQTSYADEIGNKKAKIGEVDSAAQLSTADIIQYLNEFGTPPKVYEWMLRTPPDAMHIFSMEELEELDLNSTFPKNKKDQIESFRSDLIASMQVVSCNEDAETCSDEQICERASSGKSWLSMVEAQPYVSEAKNRSLSCGVPAPTCSTDVNICTDSELCDLSVIIKGGEKQWANSDVAKKYVSLAKSRSLSCGVPQAVVCSQSTASSCSTAELCSRATTNNLHKNAWRSDTWARLYVKEAKSRGLTCGVKTQEKQQIARCSNTPSMCNDYELCRRATAVFDHKLVWAHGSDAKPFVNEARRNLLDCVQIRNPADTLNYWTRNVQHALNLAGCSVGKVDGIAGRRTKFAISSAAKQLRMPYSKEHLNDFIYLKEMEKRIKLAGSIKNCSIGSASSPKPSKSVGNQQISKKPTKPSPKKKEPDALDALVCASDIGLAAATGGLSVLLFGLEC